MSSLRPRSNGICGSQPDLASPWRCRSRSRRLVSLAPVGEREYEGLGAVSADLFDHLSRLRWLAGLRRRCKPLPVLSMLLIADRYSTLRSRASSRSLTWVPSP